MWIITLRKTLKCKCFLGFVMCYALIRTLTNDVTIYKHLQTVNFKTLHHLFQINSFLLINTETLGRCTFTMFQVLFFVLECIDRSDSQGKIISWIDQGMRWNSPFVMKRWIFGLKRMIQHFDWWQKFSFANTAWY